jgi:hypothetical protein
MEVADAPENRAKRRRKAGETEEERREKNKNAKKRSRLLDRIRNGPANTTQVRVRWGKPFVGCVQRLAACAAAAGVNTPSIPRSALQVTIMHSDESNACGVQEHIQGKFIQERTKSALRLMIGALLAAEGDVLVIRDSLNEGLVDEFLASE